MPTATPVNIDPSRTGALRRGLGNRLRAGFDQLIRDVKDLVVDQDAFGLAFAEVARVEREIAAEFAKLATPELMGEVAAQVRASTGLDDQFRALASEYRYLAPAGVFNATCELGPPAPAAVSKAGRLAQLGGKLSAVANAVPGIRQVKAGMSKAMKGIHALLEKRYGSKAATTIMTSGALGGYGVAGASFLLTGVPGIPFVNDLVSIAGHTAVAESVLQLSRLGRLARRLLGNEWGGAGPSTLGMAAVNGLRGDLVLGNAGEGCFRWRALSSRDQADQFTAWIDGKIRERITGEDRRRVLEQYISDGFERGSRRSLAEARRALGVRTAEEVVPGVARGEFLQSAFGRPVGVERLEALISRSFTDLKGVGDAMSYSMTRVLADGLVAGKSPREIAGDLTDRVEKIGKTRAETIARTEIIRAHAEGQLTALEEMGVEEVGAMVEWTTTRGACPLCSRMRGKRFKIKDARGRIPRHPR